MNSLLRAASYCRCGKLMLIACRCGKLMRMIEERVSICNKIWFDSNLPLVTRMLLGASISFLDNLWLELDPGFSKRCSSSFASWSWSRSRQEFDGSAQYSFSCQIFISKVCTWAHQDSHFSSHRPGLEATMRTAGIRYFTRDGGSCIRSLQWSIWLNCHYPSPTSH